MSNLTAGRRWRATRVLAGLFAAWAFLSLPPIALAQASSVPAQAFRYSVDLDVPDAYRELLHKHLQIYTSRVAEVTLELSGAMTEKERAARLALLREGWQLRKGMVFRQTQWEQAKRKALEACGILLPTAAALAI